MTHGIVFEQLPASLGDDLTYLLGSPHGKWAGPIRLLVIYAGPKRRKLVEGKDYAFFEQTNTVAFRRRPPNPVEVSYEPISM